MKTQSLKNLLIGAGIILPAAQTFAQENNIVDNQDEYTISEAECLADFLDDGIINNEECESLEFINTSCTTNNSCKVSSGTEKHEK